MACALQHPLGINAPAAIAGEHVDHEELPLGPVPHMIRGQLSGFTQMCLTGQAFRQCTACSQTVVDQYRQAGWSFLWQALQVTSRSDAGLASSTTLCTIESCCAVGDACYSAADQKHACKLLSRAQDAVTHGARQTCSATLTGSHTHWQHMHSCRPTLQWCDHHVCNCWLGSRSKLGMYSCSPLSLCWAGLPLRLTFHSHPCAQLCAMYLWDSFTPGPGICPNHTCSDSLSSDMRATCPNHPTIN